MKLILLGAPGSGKGTVSNFICEKYNLSHISTGDLFRAQLKIDDELTRKIKEFVLTGAYVPDWITNEIATNAINESLKKTNGFILDGYPRTINQADYLFDKFGSVDYVILLNVSNDILIKRISGRRVCSKCNTIYNIYFYNKPIKEDVCDNCGGDLIQRNDDKLDVVENRIKIYNDQTQPLIQYYKDKKILHEIDANIPIDDLLAKIEQILNKTQY